MSYKNSLATVFLAGMVVSAGFSQSNPNQKPTSSAPAAPAPAADYSKEAFVIEQFETRITAEADGTGIRERTAEIKILSDAGVKAFAVLSFPFTSANEAVDFDYVRVRKPDGTLVKTPDYNIQDMPAEVSRIAPLYSDIHEKHVAVKGLAVGDTLEYLVRVREVKAQVPGQFWYEDSFNKTSIVRDERLEVSVPKDKYIKVVSPEFKPEITEENGRRVYRWKHANLEVKEKDPYEIPRRTPPNPDVQVTTFASWEELGRWYGGLQKEALAITPAIQAKATELTKGLKTDEERIRALYEFVSLKYHYIGLDFGIGRYQPHAADDVLDNGYGDCKDKHTLLAALLKAAGYDAWPVLISATRKLDPDVPSPAQFNHVITLVPMGPQYIWLDSTPEVAPYRLLLLGLRDKQALVIPTAQPPKLVMTPANPPEPQRQDFSMEGKLDQDGTFTGHAEELLSGDSEVLMRMVFRQLPESQWKDAMQRMSQAMNFGGDVSNVKVSPPDDLEKPFQISWDYVRKNYADWEEHKIVAPLPPMGLEVYKGAKDVKPPESFLLGALGKVTYRSRVQLPDGYKAEAPSPVHLTESYAEYDDTSKIENGVMTTTRELDIKKNEVALDDWENYRTFGRSMADDEINYIALNSEGKEDIDGTFRKGFEALQQNDLNRAVTLLQIVTSSRPDYRNAHLDLGIALMMQGKSEAALAEFHKEEDIAPSEPQAYRIVTMNLVREGRLDDAVGEWRRLLKADPECAEAARNAGELLSREGKYSEAAQELEAAVKASSGNPELEAALGKAYLKAGQNDKAIASMRQAVEQMSDPVTLNDVAYALAKNKTNLDLAQQWAESAVKELERHSREDLATDDSFTGLTYQLSLTWDTLGWIYFQNGDTSRSEGYVRASWLLRQTGTVGERLGEIYEKEGKKSAAAHAYELALAALGTPGLVTRTMVYPGMPVGGASAPDGGEAIQNEITSRYQKLTGTKPEIRMTMRLPNGDWSKSAVEQLGEIRTVRFGKLPNLSGSAEFRIVMAPKGIESVDYVSGEVSLKALAGKIKEAHYQVEFPADSQARLVRRAMVSCSSITGCMAVLMPVDNPRAKEGMIQF